MDVYYHHRRFHNSNTNACRDTNTNTNACRDTNTDTKACRDTNTDTKACRDTNTDTKACRDTNTDTKANSNTKATPIRMDILRDRGRCDHRHQEVWVEDLRPNGWVRPEC